MILKASAENGETSSKAGDHWRGGGDSFGVLSHCGGSDEKRGNNREQLVHLEKHSGGLQGPAVQPPAKGEPPKVQYINVRGMAPPHRERGRPHGRRGG